ncbi:isopeptide-forming domain-containing fimbrial protein [Bifidobacterium simiarum]|uniref:SpaA-like prealbumin fold domain-containing protein n=1 Tax=Bifidobacterium simiarum TaxID=2045441 RepID=A0A2M9HF52_9BIFI|nr:isopeptide-forming domain-containing fimbrial protein [Bifidobacterium simiarum]PJM75431.1 hypothetical protein CSQ87_05350 [Bifidobacterium simiarum]
MKMRKLFAGLAAAATLLSGLAFGAATASADDTGTSVTTNATFTFKTDNVDQWTGRTIKYYKLADYVQYGTGADIKYGVKTATTADRGAIKTALDAAVGKTLTVPTDNTTDLMAWALQNGALNKEDTPWTGSTRNFARSLASNTAVTDALTEATLTGTDANRTISLSAGVYLFLDTAAITDTTISEGTNGNISNGTEQNGKDPTNNVGGKVVTQSAPIVLASGTVTNDTITDPVNGDNTIALKNHVTPVIKTFNDKDGTVSTGQTVQYTLKSDLPSVTTGFDNYKFSLTDTPGKGQTVDLSNNFTVKVGGKEIQAYDQTSNPTGYDLSFSDPAAAQAKSFKGDGTKTFTIDLSKYVNGNKDNEPLADTAVEVTYNVTINEEAKSNTSVPNSVEVNDNNSKATDKTSLTLGKFAFTKTDAQGNALAGAEFTITAVDTDATGKTDAVIPSEKDKVATSGSDGVVAFSGLADGVYEVTETKVPTGFLGHKDDNSTPSVAAKFKVTISKGAATKFENVDSYGLAPDLNNPTTDTNNNPNNLTDYKVKNVRNITELPKTGAAGIAMFLVLAAVLGGAGAVVYTQSRRTRRALHA